MNVGPTLTNNERRKNNPGATFCLSSRGRGGVTGSSILCVIIRAQGEEREGKVKDKRGAGTAKQGRERRVRMKEEVRVFCIRGRYSKSMRGKRYHKKTCCCLAKHGDG